MKHENASKTLRKPRRPVEAQRSWLLAGQPQRDGDESEGRAASDAATGHRSARAEEGLEATEASQVLLRSLEMAAGWIGYILMLSNKWTGYIEMLSNKSVNSLIVARKRPSRPLFCMRHRAFPDGNQVFKRFRSRLGA